MRGAEFQLNLGITDKLTSYFTYSYVENETTSFYETSLYTKKIGMVSVSYAFNSTSDITLAHYKTGKVAEYGHNRTDLIINNKYYGGRGIVDTSVKLQYSDSINSEYRNDQYELRTSRFNDDLHIYLTLSLQLH